MRPYFWTDRLISYITPRMTQGRWNTSQLVGICTNHTSSYSLHGIKRRHLCTSCKSEIRCASIDAIRSIGTGPHGYTPRQQASNIVETRWINRCRNTSWGTKCSSNQLARYEAEQPFTCIGRQAAMHPQKESDAVGICGAAGQLDGHG